MPIPEGSARSQIWLYSSPLSTLPDTNKYRSYRSSSSCCSFETIYKRIIPLTDAFFYVMVDGNDGSQSVDTSKIPCFRGLRGDTVEITGPCLPSQRTGSRLVIGRHAIARTTPEQMVLYWQSEFTVCQERLSVVRGRRGLQTRKNARKVTAAKNDGRSFMTVSRSLERLLYSWRFAVVKFRSPCVRDTVFLL